MANADLRSTRRVSGAGLLGRYSFPAHVGVHHPELSLGVAIPTVLEALRCEYPDAEVTFAPGCHVSEPGTDGFATALDEEGGPRLAHILSGRVNPSGRLPVSIPRWPGGQPWTTHAAGTAW